MNLRIYTLHFKTDLGHTCLYIYIIIYVCMYVYIHKPTHTHIHMYRACRHPESEEELRAVASVVIVGTKRTKQMHSDANRQLHSSTSYQLLNDFLLERLCHL